MPKGDARRGRDRKAASPGIDARGLRARDRQSRVAWWITEHVPGDSDRGMTLLPAYKVLFVEIELK
jgi:hypothetical protein